MTESEEVGKIVQGKKIKWTPILSFGLLGMDILNVILFLFL